MKNVKKKLKYPEIKKNKLTNIVCFYKLSIFFVSLFHKQMFVFNICELYKSIHRKIYMFIICILRRMLRIDIKLCIYYPEKVC